ncbi:MAG: hypothetical protein AAFR66_10200 [Bacteroidota bacterium]
MSKKDKLDTLFTSVKKVPLQMPLEEVSQLVSTFPTLPPPGSGFPFNNLNQIIMGLIGTTTLVAVLIFSQSEQKEPLVEKEYSPITQQEANPLFPTDSLNTDVAQDKGLFFAPEADTGKEEKTTVLFQVDTSEEKIAKEDDLLSQESSENSIESKTSSILEETQGEWKEGIVSPKPEKTGAGILVEELPDNCEENFRFKGDFKFFKRGLIRLLKSEQVISSMKPRVLVSFYENKVVVNRKLAPEHTQATILGFLEAHNVTPCPIRIIEIRPEYIAAGDITSDGFHGRINGRANIKDIESSLKDPIIPLESSSSLQPQKHDEAKPKFPDHCEEAIGFKGGFKPLKRELVRALKSDKIIMTIGPNVLVSFYEDKVVIDRRILPEEYQEKYLRLLRKYYIYPCAIRALGITPQYIALGDITPEGFNGLWDGKATREEIEFSLEAPIIPLGISEK